MAHIPAYYRERKQKKWGFLIRKLEVAAMDKIKKIIFYSLFINTICKKTGILRKTYYINHNRGFENTTTSKNILKKDLKQMMEVLLWSGYYWL